MLLLRASLQWEIGYWGNFAGLYCGSGRCIIEIEDQGNINNTTVVLGHESYRDGVEGIDNITETRQAAKAHTQMAIRMSMDGKSLSYNEVLNRDVFEYIKENSKNGNKGSFNGYVDKNYDSSADYWKLTDDGKLFFDGRATVTDAKTGEVLISLERLGMDDDSDYTTSLMKILGIDAAIANKLIDNMFNQLYHFFNPMIQLGYNYETNKVTGLQANEYLNALLYSLDRENLKTLDRVTDKDFKEMGTAEQLEYLKRQVVVGGALGGEDRAGMAKALRDIKGLHNSTILSNLFYGDNPTWLEKIFNPQAQSIAGDFDFMNNNLRDFLNLDDDGYDYYIHKISASSWSVNFGKDYHLDPIYVGEWPNQQKNNILKLNHDDGREIVFGRFDRKSTWKHLVTDDHYRGTYNYGHKFGFLPGTVHNRFDMAPYDRKYPSPK
jgi:hypothetical protein